MSGQVKYIKGSAWSRKWREAKIIIIVVTLFHIPDYPDPGNKNQQGWLPPAALTGCGGRGNVSYTCLLTYILTATCSEQTQLPFRTPGPLDSHASTRHHKSACQLPYHKGGWSRSGGGRQTQPRNHPRFAHTAPHSTKPESHAFRTGPSCQ